MTATEPGTFSLGTLYQDQCWIDRDGLQVDLYTMDQGYLSNALGYLRRNAGRLIELEEKADWARALRPGNWDNDYDGPEMFDPSRWSSPEAWVEQTPLAKAIQARLDEMSAQEGQPATLPPEAGEKLQRLVAQMTEDRDPSYKDDFERGHDAGRQSAGRELKRLLDSFQG